MVRSNKNINLMFSKLHQIKAHTQDQIARLWKKKLVKAQNCIMMTKCFLGCNCNPSNKDWQNDLI